VDPRAGLDAVVKRKIPSESLIIQPAAQRYATAHIYNVTSQIS